MAMRRISPFGVGQRWLCDRSALGRPSFYFIIVGEALRPSPTRRRCRIWVIGHEQMTEAVKRRYGHGVELDYTTRHLRKHGVWLRPAKVSPTRGVPEPGEKRKRGERRKITTEVACGG